MEEIEREREREREGKGSEMNCLKKRNLQRWELRRSGRGS
jgi:hypothetical protein